MFPYDAFTSWALNCREKCQVEDIVLYAVLALGAVSAGNEFSYFADVCVKKIKCEVFRIGGNFNMGMVQAGLLVAECYFLVGEGNIGCELLGSALTAIGAMCLNSEDGCGNGVMGSLRQYYNFSRDQLRECHRRTFWTAFLMGVSDRPFGAIPRLTLYLASTRVF